jgi:hypothetical protein
MPVEGELPCPLHYGTVPYAVQGVHPVANSCECRAALWQVLQANLSNARLGPGRVQ